MDQVSEDGFWRFENGQWVPTEKQLEALSLGAEPHAEGSMMSMQDQNNQGNHLINNQTNLPPTSQQPEITSQYPHNTASYDHKQPKEGSWFSTKMKIITGSSVVILTTLIILFAALSPGTSSLLDELKDSDGDGITDADELEMGTNPELRDSDNDDLDDDEDDCPVGDKDWKSTIVTDFDQDGCKDSTEDLDDDNDGVEDEEDNCDTSEVGWKSISEEDNDLDGCHDDGDADDDNDGWSDNKEQQCGTNPLSYSSVPSDFDGDLICDIVDSDDDGDGVSDVEDNFPLDSSEWADFDGDGIGDNADYDDDNDGVLDIYDLNPTRDAALYLTLDRFAVYEQMDYFDSYAEVYFCVYVNGITEGCVPDQSSYWSLYTGTNYWINTTFFIDLNESVRDHTIQISAWDSDAWEDDRIDISPDSDWNSLVFNFDSVSTTTDSTFYADGRDDQTGWDGALEYTLSPFDSRGQSLKTYNWDFEGDYYSLDWVLDYSTYSSNRALPHDIDWSGASDFGDVIDQYAAFAAPDEQYVIDLANELKSMAIQAGYTSNLEIAEFIHAFVGDIQYQYDSIDYDGQEYPKFPIEMLWEQKGDCEDAALLYISLTESIGYDSALMLGMVKSSSEEDWGGHAWAVISIPEASGAGWYGPGSKSNLAFYFVEATAHYDGSSSIGNNPWYDLEDEYIYDVE